jgi:uncharacterized membrane protein
MKFTPLFVAIGAAFTAIATQAATYQVVELAPLDGYKNSFASAINNNNQIVGNLTSRFNFPIDITGIDFTNAAITGSLTAAEIEEVKKGNINAKALSVLLFYIQSAGNYQLQRVPNVYSSRLDSKELFNLRETATPKTNDEYLVDISDRGEFVGYATAPSTRVPFTPAPTETTPNPATVQLWTPQAGARLGVVASAGGKVTLPPLYTDYGGGVSVARGINNTGRVIGSASSGMSEDNIKTMQTVCTGKVEPTMICYNARSNFYTTKPVYWQLDDNGKPGLPVALGFIGDKGTGKPHSKTEYPALTYTSELNDINDRGLIVGTSTYSNSDEIVSVYNQFTFTWQDVVSGGNHAAIFDGTDIKTFIDVKRWVSSEARAVNNKDLVVGSAYELVNGAAVPRFFVYDYATQKLTFPTTLFASANTAPEAVNDNGLVVGSSQNYIAGFSKPRTIGFLYDSVKGTFQDLNKLVSCNSPYNIVQAVDINEKNVIVANAVKEVEKRDIKGDVIKDAAGNPEKEEIPVAVQLVPIPNGSVVDCAPPADATYERQGAASGWFSLLLLPLLWFRRKRAEVTQ